MKALILFVLVTATVSLFAHSRYSMTKNDLKILNEIMEARLTPAVKVFMENASFESVSAQYSPDGLTAHYEIHGQVIIQGDIACGDAHLKIDRIAHHSLESSRNTYSATIDTSHLADYCELKYKDAKR